MPTLSTADLLSRLRQCFEAWIGKVSDAVIEIVESLRPRNTVEMVEGLDESFAVGAPLLAEPGTERWNVGSISSLDIVQGALLHVRLLPTRFTFREMEVPETATEFVDGLVRSQLDKLMPWNPASAVYGWTKTADLPTGDMKLALAGCSLQSIQPLVEVFSSSGAHHFSLSVADPKTARLVEIWNQKGCTVRDSEFLRRPLALGVAGLSCATVLTLAILIGLWSAGLGSSVASTGTRNRARLPDLNTASAESLVQRKSKGSVAVLLLNDLAKLLPDRTFVTELRIEGQKFWMTGTTDDAASLLVLMGNSDRFAGAGFFAPTTRTDGEAREIFHIEGNTKAGPRT
jgi:general secretion pathway protein L